jgi:hypothetical protein
VRYVTGEHCDDSRCDFAAASWQSGLLPELLFWYLLNKEIKKWLHKDLRWMPQAILIQLKVQ